jgi:hypothetical protein
MLGVSTLHRVFLHRKMQHISFAPTPKQTEQEVATTMFSSKLVPCLTTLQQNQKEADPLSHRHHLKSGPSSVTCSHPHLLNNFSYFILSGQSPSQTSWQNLIFLPFSNICFSPLRQKGLASSSPFIPELWSPSMVTAKKNFACEVFFLNKV